MYRMSDFENERLRSDSGSDSSLLGLPLTLRRQKSQDDGNGEDQSLDFSHLDMDTSTIEANISQSLGDDPAYETITSLNLSGNRLLSLPISLQLCQNLQVLDLSQNHLSKLDRSILSLRRLKTLIVSNNQLGSNSFPKDFGSSLLELKVLSISGNQLTNIPNELLELRQLRSLYLGGNQIKEITKDIKRLENLRVLYLGGNLLTSIPDEVGCLHKLESLSICENKVRILPPSIAQLRNLRSLALHKNLLTTLPPEIVRLRGLEELSLRNNPLVVRFIKDFTFETPSLLELAGRAVKVNKIAFTKEVLPSQLVQYLETAQRCVNPKCKGVYFDARVEHIKFVDFCGIYRLPLLQYLCSPCCTSTRPAFHESSSDSDESSSGVPLNKLRRVLLG